METKTIDKIRECKSYEDFVDLFDEAKQGCKAIFFNGKKFDKRKGLPDTIEDVFDNNVSVKYLFHNKSLFVGIGSYY